MIEALAALIKVKSIVTITLTVGFVYLAVTGAVTGEQFLMIFTTVIAFYFGTQTGKKEPEENIIIEPYDTTQFDGEEDGDR